MTKQKMRVSDEGLLEICEHEGIVPAPYLDSVGVWTFGVGHTKNAGGLNPEEMPRGMPSEEGMEEAIDLALKTFRKDLAKYEARVNKAVKVDLEQHEFDALVSFDFNTGGIYKAKLTDRINSGDPKAYESFMGWLKPPEIRGRRTAEMNLFRTGDYNANGDRIPVWRVDKRGRLLGVFKTLSGAEVLYKVREPVATSTKPLETVVQIFIKYLKSFLKTYK